MNKWAIAAITVTLAATAATGCCKKDKKDKKAESTTTTSASAANKGLNNPANDKAVVAAAKQAMTCKWGSYGFYSSCEQYKAWKKNPAFKNGAKDKTLINFLEDPNPKVRWLGARTLRSNGKSYRKDKTLATKVVDALEKETDKTAVGALASTAGNIDLTTTGLNKRVQGLLTSSKNQTLREELASDVLFTNRNAPGMYELFVKLSRTDPNPKVRLKASSSFWTGTPQGKYTEVCQLWLDLAKTDKDKDVAGHSAYHCAFTSRECVGQWDGLLTVIENKAKAGKVKSSFTASALKYFYGQKKATAAQKARALAIAKTLLANPANDSGARADALRLLGKKDPAGKTIAAKYTNDKAFFVKSAAKRVIEGK